jgi:hypothetical protein
MKNIRVRRRLHLRADLGLQSLESRTLFSATVDAAVVSWVGAGCASPPELAAAASMPPPVATIQATLHISAPATTRIIGSPLTITVTGSADNGDSLEGRTVRFISISRNDGHATREIGYATFSNNVATFGYTSGTTGTVGISASLFDGTYFGSSNEITVTTTHADGSITIPPITPPVVIPPVVTPPVVTPPASSLNLYPPGGALESFSGKRITGWAFDRDLPTAAVRVQVFVDGRLVAGKAAFMKRPRLLLKFIHPMTHGFDIALPKLSRGMHHITVVAKDAANGRATILADRIVRV